jgi:histidinol-phosphate aminotransferase
MRPLVEPHLTELVPYVPGKPIEETEREYGIKNIAKLASNENCLGPSPRGTAAAAAAVSRAHIYPDAGGFYLKQRISKLHGGVDAKQIILGNGTNEIITLMCRAFLGKNDALLNAWPSFVVYRMGAKSVGVVERAVPLTPTLHYDLPAMARTVKMVFLANPNNPTCTCFGAKELDSFLSSISPDIIVCLDEAYAEYVRRNDYQDSIQLIKQRPRTMMLRTFSKVYGLAAWRIGYGIGDPDVVSVLEKLRDAFNTSALAQIAALHALDDDDFVHKSKHHNAHELPRVEAGLVARGFLVAPSEGNFVLATLKDDDALDAASLNEGLLRRGLIVRPVANYGLMRSVRISIGTTAENDRLLLALDDIRSQRRAP